MARAVQLLEMASFGVLGKIPNCAKGRGGLSFRGGASLWILRSLCTVTHYTQREFLLYWMSEVDPLRSVTVHLSVDDVNEFAPRWEEESYQGSVDEGRPPHERVLRVRALDADCTPKNSEICKYDILDAHVPFSIDSEGEFHLSILRRLSSGFARGGKELKPKDDLRGVPTRARGLTFVIKCITHSMSANISMPVQGTDTRRLIVERNI